MKCITLIQKGVLDQLAVRYGKVEIMINFWDKLWAYLQLKASNLKDKSMITLLRKVLKVPLNIKLACLTTYINKCREMYHIHFF